MSCTRTAHAKLRELPEKEWNALEQRPDWVFDDETLEQRNCPKCGSTLARPKKENTHDDLS